nr:putative RNA-directed DNA polymerase, eukaryota, reverse transcriptase zinc-binding domain protein [Tanacetum cinerariifolium]
MLQLYLWRLRQIWGNVHFDFASTSARGLSGDGLWILENVQVKWIVVQAGFFNDFITNNSLIDIPLGGVPDHRPILIKESIVDYGPTPFCFFHSWLEMDGFHDLVVQTWSNDGIVDGNGFILFKKKLQHLKKVIHVWNASRKSDTYTLKKDHQNRLSLIDSKIDQGCANEEDFMKRRGSLAILSDMDRLEAKDYAQKAKIKWAIEGDENTSFFHGSLKKKRLQLAIRDLNSPLSLLPLWIRCHLVLFPKFIATTWSSPSLVMKLKRESGIMVETVPQVPMVSRFIFSTFWDTIADDVVRFVQEFSLSHEILKGCNPSFIALIPKIHNAKFVFDFRPISLIGCQYKIIGKLLANRLSNVIRDCISPFSRLSLRGYILNEPLILNEILTEYRQHHKELLVFKVDLEKAFDSLRWDILDKVMKKIGFSIKWRSWISGCLCNARSSILVNGSPTKEFELFKGLRQGDPLSFFLFILAMEGLHSLTCKAEELGLFKGASVGRDNMSISHLMYDVIFFEEWSWVNTQNLISMLHCFFLISGLKINVDKSNVLGVGVSDVETSIMARIIGCRVSKLPFKYSGVPVGCNMNCCVNWDMITQIFSSKLSSWKAMFLLVGGRLSLIKAVLGNLPTYFMFIYLMPVSIRSNLESMRNKFFRGADQNENKMSIPLLLSDWSTALRHFPRGGAEMTQFDDLKAVIGSVSLMDQRDTWQWSLDVAGGFSMASARAFVDDTMLEADSVATRWNRTISIKVNVFLRRLHLNKLPSKVNLEMRGVQIESILCQTCQLDVETEWYDWLDVVRVAAMACSALEGVGGTLFWSIWNFRNQLLFSCPPPKKATI